jgi:hypothetical protein
MRSTSRRITIAKHENHVATGNNFSHRKDPYDFVKNPERKMGSLGSGRTSHIGAAGKCEHWRSIDLANLKRMGLLRPIAGGNIRAIVWHVDGRLDKLGVIPEAKGICFVKRDGQGQLSSLFVPYVITSPMFGGHRKWFECPGCRRPCRVLYGTNSLRCRRCRRLKYASQSEARPWRAQRRACNIRRRLGARGNSLDAPFPAKPRGMRRTTYERLRAEHDALQQQWLAGLMAVVGKLDSRLKRP